MKSSISVEQKLLPNKHYSTLNGPVKYFTKFICYFFLTVSILFLSSVEFKCAAQTTTAKERLSQVTDAVHSVASDAKLVFATGDDLSLTGKSSKWIYIFKSETNNRLYEYWYEDGSVVARSSLSEWQDFQNSPGMTYLPDGWKDSNEIISIAESNGGSSFRNSHGGNAAIRFSLLPSAFGSSGNTPHLYTVPAWEISYRQNDTYFDITINAQTGEVLTNEPFYLRTVTAKELLNNMDSLAHELTEDARLFKVWSPGVDLEGKSTEWVFEYHSISRYTVFLCTYNFSKIRRESESSPEEHDYSSSIEIPDSWIDSDSAIVVANAQGLEDFINTHPDGNINILLSDDQPGLPVWKVNYHSPTGSQSYEIPAIDVEEMNNTAQTNLNEIQTMAESFAYDAELVFVYANYFDISYTGSGLWHYVFGSESQQQIYEFYATLTGETGQTEEPTQFFSIEDFLSCKPFPDSWIDSDSILTVTENSGGSEFRQTYPDWQISAILTDSPYGDGFKWEINYYSPGTDNHLQFFINAKGKLTTDDWPQIYGGNGAEVGQSVQETSDGGFVVTGYTNSFGQGMADTWLIKTDKFGNLEWDKTYGGSYNDYGMYIDVTDENEYLIAHNTSDASGIYSGNLLLTDTIGNEKMGRQFGSGGITEVNSIHKTTDGSYIMAGSSSPAEGEPFDFLLIKIDDNGDQLWRYTYGGVGDDACISMQQTSDGGYILLGTTSSYGDGGIDLWLVKTDEDGNKVWDKTFGGPGNDEGKSLELTSDGGFILAGQTDSYGEGGSDCYLVKTDENGNEQWSKTFGSQYEDEFNGLIQAPDGGYISVGTTDRNGNSDVLLIKTDSSGNKIWEQIIGGDLADVGKAICNTSDGNFAITGRTRNWGADGNDIFLMKIIQEEGPSIVISKLEGQLKYSQAGDAIDYTIVLKNTGNVPLEQVNIVDLNADEGSLNYSSSLLGVGESITCTATHTITQQDIDNDSIVNAVTVSAYYNENEITASDTIVSYYEENTTFSDYTLTDEYFRVYPNPSSNYVTIEFDNPYGEEYQITMIDSSGKIVLLKSKISSDTININTSNFLSGLYYITLRGEKIYRATVIIQQ